MADLLHPATTSGPTATYPASAPPDPTGSPAIRGPKAIMAERRRREKEKLEQEQRVMEEQARQEAMLEQEREEREQMERHMERERERRKAAGADVPTQTLDPAVARRQQRAAEALAQLQATQSHQQSRTSHTQLPMHGSQRKSSQAQPPVSATGFSGPPPMTTGPAQPDGPAYPTMDATAGRPRNSFPHAFERWEALSAHWEGMTSFWIRKLQSHAEELERDPLSVQLNRQVQDLSAAGANLFHAVVELQRLRASSERKFQRWFFETRTEIEKLQEQNAMLKQTIEDERHNRAEAVRDAVEHEGANSKTQRQLAEMRKELLISKEEARRAWEELGRREEAEREWTASLQQGLPTSVGGVQVVPMNAGIPSRHASGREQQQQPRQEYSAPSDYAESSGGRAPHPSSSAGHGQSIPATSGPGYYRGQPETVHEQRSYGDGRSEGGYSEGEYAIDKNGNFIRDSMGNKIPFRGGAGSPADEHRRRRRGEDDDDEDAPSDLGMHEDYDMMPPGSSHGVPPPLSYPPSSQPPPWMGGPEGQAAQQNLLSPEYAGQGYAAPGWETVPRHRHPTRLSVIEEDERSRASRTTSQISRP